MPSAPEGERLESLGVLGLKCNLFIGWDSRLFHRQFRLWGQLDQLKLPNIHATSHKNLPKQISLGLAHRPSEAFCGTSHSPHGRRGLDSGQSRCLLKFNPNYHRVNFKINFKQGTWREVTEDCDTAFGWNGDWGGDEGDHMGDEEHELRSSFSPERSRDSDSLK